MFLLTLAVVASIGTVVFLFARGYRFSPGTRKLSANGILVAKSNPDGAQLFLNGELETATNATINLEPGDYDVEIKKEGYKTWVKRVVVEKEVVTELNANLFKSAPSLVPITFNSVETPTASSGFSKILFVVPATIENVAEDLEGLWLLETLNLPIGFNQGPKRVTDGNLTGATFTFSPNEREVLFQTAIGSFLVDLATFTPQSKRVNIVATQEELLAEWQEEESTKLIARLRKLPTELNDILMASGSKVFLSPDEEKVLYLAGTDGDLPDGLIPELPGSSTQKEERNIASQGIYVYDIKEDRNFKVGEQSIPQSSACITNQSVIYLACDATISWYPTSLNLLLASPNSISVLDYDGANNQSVYSGSFVAPYAFSTNSPDRIIFLTNLGANSTEANLYSLTVR